MNKFKIILSSFLLSFLFSTNSFSQEEQSVFEEVIVTAEKRDESLQDVSQAVTAITDNEIEAKNIEISTTYTLTHQNLSFCNRASTLPSTMKSPL